MITPSPQLSNYLTDKTIHNYYSLMDIATRHIVVFSVFNSTILAIKSTNFDLQPIGTLNITKYLQVVESVSNRANIIDPKQCSINLSIPWIYKVDNNRWKKEDIFSLPEEITNKYFFIQQKALAIDNVYAAIDNILTMSIANNNMQDIIYNIKYKQALSVLSKTIDPLKQPAMCNMVSTYSDLMNISLTEAANEIVIQHNLYVDLLAEQEYFRLKFIKQIKDAATIDDLVVINSNLIKETEWYCRG